MCKLAAKMKNVTITVEDATLEWVRIEAAKRNTSVSRLVGEMLTDKMQFDDAYARAPVSYTHLDVYKRQNLFIGYLSLRTASLLIKK